MGKKILIVYHSQSGSTAQLAQAVQAGAQQEPEAEVQLIPAMEACSEDLRHCDGVLLGCAENFGFMSGGLLDFFNRSYYPLLPHQLNLPYGVFMSTGNDGMGAIRQIERIARGYPLKKVADPIIVKGAVTSEGLQQCKDLGQGFSAGVVMGIF